MEPTAYAILQASALKAAMVWVPRLVDKDIEYERLNYQYGVFLDKLVRDHEVLFGVPLIDAMGNPIESPDGLELPEPNPFYPYEGH